MNYKKHHKNKEYSIPIYSITNYDSSKVLEKKSDTLAKNVENSIDRAIEKVKKERESQKLFRLNVNLDKLVLEGKASYEPLEKFNEFGRRLHNYITPLKHEFKKKQYQSREYARRNYLD